MSKLIDLFHKLQANPVIERAEHTVWQAAGGAFVASLSGTHGDVRVAITVAVAAGLSALKSIVFPPAGTVAAVVPVAAPVAAPVVAVDVVSTPSTPASADPPAAQ